MRVIPARQGLENVLCQCYFTTLYLLQLFSARKLVHYRIRNHEQRCVQIRAYIIMVLQI